jgi:hypothetical protein
MAFFGAGKLNGIAKRSHGIEQFVLVSQSASTKPGDVYTAIPGTGALKNALGPQAIYGTETSSVGSGNIIATSPDGVWMAQSSVAAGYPNFQLYEKVNGVYQAINMPGLSITLPPAQVYSLAFLPSTGYWWNAGYYVLVIGFSGNLYEYTCPVGTTNWSLTNFQTITNIPYTISPDPTGSYLFIGTNSAPYFYTYYINQSSGSIGLISSSTAFPSFTPGATINASAWSPNNNLFALSTTTISLFSYTSGTNTIAFTKTPFNLNSSGNIDRLTFNNTSSGFITTSSLVSSSAAGNVYINNLNLNGSSTVASSTSSISGNTSVPIAIDPTGQYLAIGSNYLSYFYIYKRVGNTFTQVSTGSSYAFDITWNTATNVISVAGSNIPYVYEYSINTSTGAVTNIDSWGRNAAGFTTTATSFASIANAGNIVAPNTIKFNPQQGNILASGYSSVPYFRAYYYDYLNTNNLTSLSTGSAASMSINNLYWSPNGQIVTLLGSSSPYINNYYISGSGTSTTFTKLAQPVDYWGTATLQTSDGGPFATWSPDGSTVVVTGANSSPYGMFYSVNYAGTATTFTRGTSTQFNSILSATTYASSFSTDGSFLLIGGSSGIQSYGVNYAGTATTFTKFNNSLITNTIYDIKFSKNGKWLGLAVSGSTRGAYIYSISGTGTATTFTLASPTITNPSETSYKGQFSNDSSLFYLFDETAPTSATYPGISALVYSSHANTWTYTTTNATIDMPLYTINMDWRVDI